MNIKGIAVRSVAVLAVVVAGVVWVGCTEDKGTGQETYYTLDVEISPSGAGHVELSPSGSRYKAETNVRVTAVPNVEHGCVFDAWSGNLDSPDSRTTIRMNGNMTIVANFDCSTEPPPPPPPPPTGDNDPVRIGDLMWTKNLNIETPDSWCYDDDPANCAIYGRLYTWEAAKSACASLGGGWRLPSNEDWYNLVEYAGGWGDEGVKLKSTSGWNRCWINGDGEEEDCVDNSNGTDDYGFSALPGGVRDFDDGSFNGADNFGLWWSATEYDAGNAYGLYMGYDIDYVSEYWHGVRSGFSARCVGVVQD